MDSFLQTMSAPPPDHSTGVGRSNLCVSSFQEALKIAADVVITTFEAEIKRKQLYYHGLAHVRAVAQRSCLIFDTVVPFLAQADDAPVNTRALAVDWDRQRGLLYLSAIAHDMIQLFVAPTSPHTPRRRESGHSEQVTFKQLQRLMAQLNLSAKHDGGERSTELFTAADIALVREAITATVCQIDPADGGIYQPSLYAPSGLSLPARCLALADIGTLGMEGITAYQKEGSLLLLEENLDVVAFVRGTRTFDGPSQESLRQRLLKRARFQIVFAKSRLNRLDEELQGLPEEAIARLKQKIFKYLTPETVTTLVEMTPTAEETSLTTLLDFFQLSACL